MENQTNPLTTKTIVAEYLDLRDENGNPTEPDVLTQIINYVSKYIESYTGRYFVYGQYTQEVYPDEVYLQAKALPIDRDVALQVADESGQYDNISAVVEHASAGIIKLARSGVGIKVVYSGGYQGDTNVPPDVMGLATRLSARIYEKRLSEGKTNESVEGQSITWGQFITADEKELLDTYRVY